jgi:hypothetical protein
VTGIVRAGTVWAVLLLLCACAGRQSAVPDDGRAQARVGLYRAKLEQEGRPAESFKLLLWAGGPDRLHGEVIGPMGRTALVFDGGGGRIAVTFVRDRVSYVGKADGRAMEKLIGIPINLEELVHGLLTGEIEDETLTISRAPDVEGLPERLLVEEAERSLRLELKRFKPLKGPEAALGRGEPPPGMDVLSIDLLEPVSYTDGAAAGGR